MICGSADCDESPASGSGNTFIGKHTEAGRLTESSELSGERHLLNSQRLEAQRPDKVRFFLFFFRCWQIRLVFVLHRLLDGWRVQRQPSFDKSQKKNIKTTFIYDEVSSLLPDSHCLLFLFLPSNGSELSKENKSSQLNI